MEPAQLDTPPQMLISATQPDGPPLLGVAQPRMSAVQLSALPPLGTAAQLGALPSLGTAAQLGASPLLGTAAQLGALPSLGAAQLGAFPSLGTAAQPGASSSLVEAVRFDAATRLVGSTVQLDAPLRFAVPSQLDAASRLASLPQLALPPPLHRHADQV